MSSLLKDLTLVFGGRFDPPHRGHFLVIQELLQLPFTKKLLVIPTGAAPHAPLKASGTHRLEMLRHLIPNSIQNTLVEVLDYELREAEKGKINYSFDTLSFLVPQHGKLAFVLGLDQWEKISTWYRFPDVLGLCHWIVLARQSAKQLSGLERVKQVFQTSLQQGILVKQLNETTAQTTKGTLALIQPTQAPALSSSEIRGILEKGQIPPKEALLPQTLEYLKANHLYGT